MYMYKCMCIYYARMSLCLVLLDNKRQLVFPHVKIKTLVLRSFRTPCCAQLRWVCVFENTMLA